MYGNKRIIPKQINYPYIEDPEIQQLYYEEINRGVRYSLSPHPTNPENYISLGNGNYKKRKHGGS